MDTPAAQRELALLPADFPTVFAGGSGPKRKIGSCYRDAPADHIVRKSYEAYFKGNSNMDRPTWDQLRTLYGSRPSSRALFDTSPPGDIQVADDHHLTWKATPNRNRTYAYVRDFDALRAALTALMLHRPARMRE